MVTIEVTLRETKLIESIEPIADLLNQIFTRRRPGTYQFRRDFPSERGHWLEVARELRTSSDRTLRSYGLLMDRFIKAIDAIDDAEQGTRQFRRRLVKFTEAADRLGALSAELEKKVRHVA